MAVAVAVGVAVAVTAALGATQLEAVERCENDMSGEKGMCSAPLSMRL